MITSFCHIKGGSGKTSLSLALAAYIAGLDRSVLVLDADPQASASTWLKARPEEMPCPFTVVAMASDKIHRDLPALAKGYDHTIIDTPPQVISYVRSAVIASDIVITPVASSNYDLWPVDSVAQMVADAQMIREEIKHGLVHNRCQANTKMGEAIAASLGDRQIPLIATIMARTIFEQSSSGLTLQELNPNSKAAAEIEALANAILKLVGETKW